MYAAVWGLLGTLVGAFASMATTWLTTRSSYLLQQEKTREERGQIARAFQQQTLLDLQEAIHDALRLVTRAHIEDSKAAIATGQWGKSRISDDLDEEIRLAHRRVSLLVERVADTNLRMQVKALMSHVAEVLFSSSEREADHHLSESYKEAGRAIEAIGTVLRQQFDVAVLPRRQG